MPAWNHWLDIPVEVEGAATKPNEILSMSTLLLHKHCRKKTKPHYAVYKAIFLTSWSTVLSQRTQALTHGKTQQQKGSCVPQFPTPPRKHARFQFQGGQENTSAKFWILQQDCMSAWCHWYVCAFIQQRSESKTCNLLTVITHRWQGPSSNPGALDLPSFHERAALPVQTLLS